MRFRLLLNLCLLLAVIGLALFLAHGNGKKAAPADVTLTAVKPETVSHIRIVRTGQDEISFAKQSGIWMMQNPYQLRASEIRIETMLKLLGAHSYAQYHSKAIQLSRLLLDQPDRKSTRLNSSHIQKSRMPSSA